MEPVHDPHNASYGLGMPHLQNTPHDYRQRLAVCTAHPHQLVQKALPTPTHHTDSTAAADVWSGWSFMGSTAGNKTQTMLIPPTHGLHSMLQLHIIEGIYHTAQQFKQSSGF
jgi:hypothetical protein